MGFNIGHFFVVSTGFGIGLILSMISALCSSRKFFRFGDSRNCLCTSLFLRRVSLALYIYEALLPFLSVQQYGFPLNKLLMRFEEPLIHPERFHLKPDKL